MLGNQRLSRMRAGAHTSSFIHLARPFLRTSTATSSTSSSSSSGYSPESLAAARLQALEDVCRGAGDSSFCSFYSYLSAPGTGGSLGPRSLQCSPTIALFESVAPHAELQRRICLAILRDANSGLITPTHATTVCRDLLFQIGLLSAAGEMELREKIVDLQVELLSVLAVLSATAVINGQIGEPMQDACFWINELCDALRQNNRSLSEARQCLSVLLPLLPTATAEDKNVFQMTLRNCYAKEESDLNKAFGLFNKVHFVTTVCIPYAIMHFVVIPVAHATVAYQIAIGFVCAVSVYWLFGGLFSSPNSVEERSASTTSFDILAKGAANSTLLESPPSSSSQLPPAPVVSTNASSLSDSLASSPQAGVMGSASSLSKLAFSAAAEAAATDEHPSVIENTASKDDTKK